MRLVFHHSVPKRTSEPELNEDYYLPVCPSQGGPFVLSDGASESYDARTWSRLLVRRYRRRPSFSPAWVSQATANYVAIRDRSKMSWSQQAAFQRGSFATLLAVNIATDARRVDVLAIGDTIAAYGIKHTFRKSFPYASADQFASRPLLISTRQERNQTLFRDTRRFRTSWNVAAIGDLTVMAMTDALGAWMLSDPEARFSVLARIRTPYSFVKLVENERQAGRIRRDDTTLLILS
jgi:hypothetical protein